MINRVKQGEMGVGIWRAVCGQRICMSVSVLEVRWLGSQLPLALMYQLCNLSGECPEPLRVGLFNNLLDVCPCLLCAGTSLS